MSGKATRRRRSANIPREYDSGAVMWSAVVAFLAPMIIGTFVVVVYAMNQAWNPHPVVVLGFLTFLRGYPTVAARILRPGSGTVRPK